MRALALAAELAIIAAVSAVAGFLWNLLPKSQNGNAMAILMFLGVAVIHFFYDDKPKGQIRQDVALILMSFFIEALLIGVSALLCLVAVFPLAFVVKLFGWPLPEFADLVLAGWLLINLWLGWTEIVHWKPPSPSPGDYSKRAF